MKNAFFWAPRVLTILYIIGIGAISMSMFNLLYSGLGFWASTAYFLACLIPSCVLVIALAIAWQWEYVGGAAFLLLSFGYMFWMGDQLFWSTCAVICFPLLLIGILFIAHRAFSPRQKKRNELY